MQITAEDLQEYANSFARGYLKSWKAGSMLWTLRDMPGIMENRERLIRYVKNCLLMEGFDEQSCIKIAEYIEENR